MPARGFVAIALAILAAGCAELPSTAGRGAPPPTEGTGKLSPAAQALLARHNIKPIVARPLNVASRCAHQSEDGTATRLDLLVRESVVERFAAEVSMKGHGTCRFDLADFQQTGRTNQASLRNKKSSACQVNMWEEAPRVMVAFSQCPASCDGQAFDYLWPIIVDSTTGQCF